MTAISQFPLSPTRTAPCEEVIIVVCRKCRSIGSVDSQDRPGEQLAEAAAEAVNGSGIRIHEVACLGNCRQGVSAAIIAPQGWSYLFGGLSPADGMDLAKSGKLLARSDGQIPWSDWPDALKRGLVGYIPSLDTLVE